LQGILQRHILYNQHCLLGHTLFHENVLLCLFTTIAVNTKRTMAMQTHKHSWNLSSVKKWHHTFHAFTFTLVSSSQKHHLAFQTLLTVIFFQNSCKRQKNIIVIVCLVCGFLQKNEQHSASSFVCIQEMS
jgi:hypothetical protein